MYRVTGEIGRKLVWFSCGATSAVAWKIAVEEYGKENILPVYCDVGSEHADNKRFLADCEKWVGQKVTILKHPNFKNIDEVFEDRRFLVGPKGAPCTMLLKREVREMFQNHDDLHIFGYDADEIARAASFATRNHENFYAPLIKHGIDHAGARAIIANAGIELPVMYKLGYNHNNCIGCVKGGAGYWNKIRLEFPEVFQRRAEQERKFNFALNSKTVKGVKYKVFLDELDPDAGRDEKLDEMKCDFNCSAAVEKFDFNNSIDKKEV